MLETHPLLHGTYPIVGEYRRWSGEPDPVVPAALPQREPGGQGGLRVLVPIQVWYMVVCFWYFVRSDFSSVHGYSISCMKISIEDYMKYLFTS